MKQSMRYLTLSLMALTIVFGVIVMGFGIGAIGFSNDANGYEVDIPAQYKQMQNIYDNGYKQVLETADVANNYTDKFKDIWQGMLTDRYGKNGSQAVFQFIKEANPNIDTKLFERVQEQVETFHSNFSASQTEIIAKKQAYGRFLATNTDSRLYNVFFHYPHIKCGVPDGSADDYQIVTSGKTQTDFANHEADPLNLRDSKK